MDCLQLDTIPAEVVLHIITFLTPSEVTRLLAVSRRMRTMCLDNRYWREICFDGSRRASLLTHKFRRRRDMDTAASAATASPSHAARPGTTPGTTNGSARPTLRPVAREPRRVEIRAAWNPVFEGEMVSWYDEYIQRHAPIAVSWFELPRRHDRRMPDNTDVIDVCGVALYRPQADTLTVSPTVLAVAPLADGAVCLWDVTGTTARRGAIVQRSAPGLLFAEQPQPAVFGITECVSVDSQRHRAYFAMENRLVEVDLQTLSVVDVATFSQPITALSAAHPSVPLTVGMHGGVRLHDTRARTWAGAAGGAAFRSVDELAAGRARTVHGVHGALFPQAAGPLAVLHAQQAGRESEEEAPSHDIYAAGRIPSILHYDRRNMATVKDAIHSGASLCGLASIPYPFPSLEGYGRRESNADNNGNSGNNDGGGGRTLVACGEYKSKGSLELYPMEASAPGATGAPMINRQTSSFAKIVSVATHGKRIVVADGAGLVRWFERDGFTEARQCVLGCDDYVEDAVAGADTTHATRGGARGLGAQAAGTAHARQAAMGELEPGDMARKLLPVQGGSEWRGHDGATDGGFVNNDVLFWTGEKLGIIGFSPKPGFRSADFVERMATEEERATEREGQAYRSKMRQLFKSARRFGEASDSDD